MPARKEQHPCFPNSCGLPVVLFLLFSLVGAGSVFGAGSQFELEIGDLERGAAVSNEVKKPQSPPQAKRRGTRAGYTTKKKAEGRQEGEYVRYTIRSGDTIHKILTTRFGLSAKKAERLIPEVKRINGIVDTSGLQIGQTILLPLARKKAVVPQEAAPVPAPLPAPPAEVESLAPETPLPTSPTVDEGMLRRARDFWARLFPERKPVEPLPGKGAAGAASHPFLTGVNGKEIRIVPPGMQHVFGNLSGAGTENRETVVADPANEKGFVKELLHAAGFATTDGGAPLEFGSEPKLSLKVDVTAAQRIPGVASRKTILVPLEPSGCQALPESFVSYLAAKDFRLVAWCDSSVITPLFARLPVVYVPTGKPVLMADAVLDALSLNASRDYSIEIVVGQTGAAPLRVTVDRYFEAEGKRFFLDFGNAAPNRATLFRLLELAGYQKIAVGDTDDFRSVAAKISAAVSMPAAYRKHIISSLPDGLFALEMTGILFPQPNTGGKKIFLTDIPLEQPFFDLLKTVPWGTK